MLAKLRSDNEQLVGFMRDAHFVCGRVDDVASIRRGPERVVDADGSIVTVRFDPCLPRSLIGSDVAFSKPAFRQLLITRPMTTTCLFGED